jgi:hypothetical protein
MGLSSLTRGGWRSGITIPLPQAGGHDVDDQQERIAPSSQQRCTAAQPLPARGAERGGGGMLAEGPGQAAESAATAGRAWPTFQPADGGHTHSGPVGQFLL